MSALSAAHAALVSLYHRYMREYNVMLATGDRVALRFATALVMEARAASKGEFVSIGYITGGLYPPIPCEEG